MNEIPEYLTLAEVQKHLRFRSRNATSDYIKRNRLPYTRVVHRILIHKEPFIEHLKSVTCNVKGQGFQW